MAEDNNKQKTSPAAAADVYKYGFVTDVDTDTAPKGLNEGIIAFISDKKGEPVFMRQRRLEAFRHWCGMKEPHWANFHYDPLDYQAIRY